MASGSPRARARSAHRLPSGCPLASMTTRNASSWASPLRAGSPPRVNGDPFCGGVARAAPEDPVPGRRHDGSPGVGVGDRSPSRPAILEGDPGSRKARLVPQDLHDPRQDLHRGRACCQLAAHREQGPGLALAGTRRLLAHAQQGRHLADEEADRQEEDQVQPLHRVGDGEGKDRGDEEEVVEDEGGEGRDQGGDASREERRRGHRQDVDGGRVRNPDDMLEERHDRRGGREGGAGRQDGPGERADACRVHGHRLLRRSGPPDGLATPMPSAAALHSGDDRRPSTGLHSPGFHDRDPRRRTARADARIRGAGDGLPRRRPGSRRGLSRGRHRRPRRAGRV